MLTGKQVRYLRSLGHHLQPVVMVGKEEVNDQVIASVDQALLTHELIKVRLQEGCTTPRAKVAETLAQGTGAEVAQVLGRTILLYRTSDKNLIELPKAR
ncbi:MAG: ribosome assembly RNA-binding protein YhbY [Desulfuromonadaceae bacterium]|nr:ribosome assembly RNA-binding protein YhbY [Desulfuromonadaceae bacterium]